VDQLSQGTGWIEVICGSMFSGKSEELIRRIRRAQIARQKVQVFKPAIDKRDSEEHIVSHDDRRIPSEPVGSAKEILARTDPDTHVVGIDEAQFFSLDLIDVCERLAQEGKRVIVAGLDQDYRGRPFEPIPQLLAVAEVITKNMAVCMVCGKPANKSQRLVEGDQRFMLGAEGTYEPRCRHCFRPPEQPGRPKEGKPAAD
jgi:thymidine kinase